MTFECALAILTRTFLRGGKWNLGRRMSGFPLNPDQARLVLSLPVFAQPHDPGTAPG